MYAIPILVHTWSTSGTLFKTGGDSNKPQKLNHEAHAPFLFSFQLAFEYVLLVLLDM